MSSFDPTWSSQVNVNTSDSFLCLTVYMECTLEVERSSLASGTPLPPLSLPRHGEEYHHHRPILNGMQTYTHACILQVCNAVCVWYFCPPPTLTPPLFVPHARPLDVCHWPSPERQAGAAGFCLAAIGLVVDWDRWVASNVSAGYRAVLTVLWEVSTHYIVYGAKGR